VRGGGGSIQDDGDETMIAIINKGGPADGVCTYTVGINRDVVTEFKHDRRKGLARCLRDAARAVDAEMKKKKNGDDDFDLNFETVIEVYNRMK